MHRDIALNAELLPTVAANYNATMNIVDDWVSKLSTEEQTLILGGTCEKFYSV